MNRFIIFLLLTGAVFATEEEMLGRLSSFCLLRDKVLSTECAKEALQRYPSSQPIHLLSIRLFAKAGKHREMMEAFRTYKRLFPEESLPRDTLEEMAWGVIEKGHLADSPLTRAYSLIAAMMGNDARGSRLLALGLKDHHRLIRSLSAEFSSRFRDEVLQEAVLERLKVEHDRQVRLLLLESAGKMKVKEAEPMLFQILEDPHASEDEILAAIQALVSLKESADKREILRFLKSPRAPFRSLAAELIRFNDKKEDAYLLLPMLDDPSPQVKKSAYLALASLRPDENMVRPYFEKIKDEEVRQEAELGVVMSYTWTLYNREEGQRHLRFWLESPDQKERILASGALRSLGKYGFPLTMDMFLKTNDPFVKINLAEALIYERVRPDLGAEALYRAVTEHKERWMREEGVFMRLCPCTATHRIDIPGYPEAVNQMARLEVLSLIAIMKHPKAKEAISEFLRERAWGITGAAAALLLTEGDEDAIDLIKTLLQDPQEKVELQAALILAMWGNDKDALKTLERLYPKVASHQKEGVIEALGRIGDASALPFLIERLEESKESRRMIAASSILQILYH